MTDTMADLWARRLAGEALTGSEGRALAATLGGDDRKCRQALEDERLDGALRVLMCSSLDSRSFVEGTLSRLEKGASRDSRRALWRLGMIIAAALLIAWVFSSTVRWDAGIRVLSGRAICAGNRVKTAAEPATIELSGRVRVELEPGGELVLDTPGQVQLAQGAAAFTVPPRDKSHPWKVVTRLGEVEVVGTRFTVALVEGSMLVSVSEGSVHVRSSAGQEALKAGESAKVEEHRAPKRCDVYGDPLPEGAIARLGTTRFRHAGGVWRIAYSPDGKWLVAAGGDSVGVFDATTGRLDRILGYKRDWRYHGVAFSPDGRTIATAVDPGVVALWDFSSGERLASFTGHRSKWGVAQVLAVAFAPHGRTLASAGTDDTVRLWDLEKRKEIACFSHESYVNAIAFSPDGKRMAAATGDVGGIQRSPSRSDNSVWIWDLIGQRVERKLPYSSESMVSSVLSVAFSPDGATIASSGRDGALQLWNVATGERLHRSQVSAQGDPCFVAFSPDGQSVACAGFDGAIQLLEPTTGRVLMKRKDTGCRWNFLSFAPDGKTLACSGDNGIHLFALPEGKEHPVAGAGHCASGSCVFEGPEKGLIVSYNQWGDRLILWDAASCRVRSSRECHVLGRSLDNRLLASATDEELQLVDTVSGDVRCRVRGKFKFGKAAFSNDGKSFAVANKEEVQIGDVASGDVRRRISLSQGEAAGAPSLEFSRDGKTLLVGTTRDDQFLELPVQLWDIETGERLSQDMVPGRGSIDTQFSPDGAVLAFWYINVRIFDWATRREVMSLEKPAGNVVSFAQFSPDGHWLAVGNNNEGIVRVWDLLLGRELLTLKPGPEQGRVTGLAWSRDGRALYTTHGTILVWDVSEVVGGTREASFDALESSLISDRAQDAWRAIESLAAMGDRAVDRLSEWHKQERDKVEARARHLVVQLDSDSFDERDTAYEELKKLALDAESVLREAVVGSPLAEVKQRVADLLGLLDEWLPRSPSVLRVLRSIQVAERVGTSRAREFLEWVAKTYPSRRVSHAAKGALERLR